jgi:hypothetical protein
VLLDYKECKYSIRRRQLFRLSWKMIPGGASAVSLARPCLFWVFGTHSGFLRRLSKCAPTRFLPAVPYHTFSMFWYGTTVRRAFGNRCFLFVSLRSFQSKSTFHAPLCLSIARVGFVARANSWARERETLSSRSRESVSLSGGYRGSADRQLAYPRYPRSDRNGKRFK